MHCIIMHMCCSDRAGHTRARAVILIEWHVRLRADSIYPPTLYPLMGTRPNSDVAEVAGACSGCPGAGENVSDTPLMQ
jgi:hypothetical protein